jgi:hypothetical protein
MRKLQKAPECDYFYKKINFRVTDFSTKYVNFSINISLTLTQEMMDY